MRTIAFRIALASMAVTAAAIALIAIGVFVFASRAFEQLMVEHGTTIDDARAMFDQSIAGFVVIAGVAALVGSVLLAILLARWLSGPLRRISTAAKRLAGGERAVRVVAEGPREVVSLASSFNQLAARLEEQERIRSEFIANAAHELRTPLTNLLGYLEALRDGVVPATPETFASLSEEVDRLVRLSRSLDALAIGDRAVAAEVAELDVRASIEMAVDLALPLFERKRVALTMSVPAMVRARANRDHLAQVLANLLQNAERYTPVGGRVAVSAVQSERCVRVIVANSGDGIPAPDLPRVFERFYRVDKSRDRERGGAGIGLAIVKQLVELGGGSVGVESADGMTRFWFQLPV
jgi:signal transduction histidine kinase